MRAPTGVIQVGVTKAIPAADMEQSDPATRKDYLDRVLNLAADDLKRVVKGARPMTDFDTVLKGPINDPLLGRIYGMTISAGFFQDDLDADSIAYQTHSPEGTR